MMFSITEDAPRAARFALVGWEWDAGECFELGERGIDTLLM